MPKIMNTETHISAAAKAAILRKNIIEREIVSYG